MPVMSMSDFQSEADMTKPRDSKRRVWFLMGVCALLAGMISSTSAAHPGSRASSDGAHTASGPAFAEIVPRIARADVDVLDLQLD